jgi:hypothetical protein
MIEALFMYSLKSAFVLMLLYVPYALLLRKESFFRINRMVLLMILLLSFVLPLINIQTLSWDSHPVVQVAQQQMIEIGMPVKVATYLPEVTVHGKNNSIQISWFHIASLVFAIGALVILLWQIGQIVRMGHVIRSGSLWHQQEEGVNIFCHADDVSPFSWMKNIVISAKDYEENSREILLHEKGHVRALHSWDLLLLAMLQVLQWWNPFVYILGYSLRDVHEYEADDSVLRSGVSAKAYQLLLIRKVVGASSYTFANNFDHSLTLKRITMMQKSKSSVWMRSKVLYIIPMATLALSAFATSEPTSPSGKDVAQNEDKVIKIKTSGQVVGVKKSSPIVKWAEDVNVVYLLDGEEASEESIKTLTPEKIESVTVITNSEATEALGYADRNVISIKTKKDAGNVLSNYDAPQKISYNPTPAVLPQFAGGEMDMMRWLAANVKYPSEAQRLGVMGKIQVEFFVTEKGQVTNIRAIAFDKHVLEGSKTLPEVVVTAFAKEKKAQNKELSAQEQEEYMCAVQALLAESVRVIGAMPAWEPGYVDKEKTKPCTTRFVLPLVFRLG